MMDWDAATWAGAIFTLVVVPAVLWFTVWLARDDDDSGMT